MKKIVVCILLVFSMFTISYSQSQNYVDPNKLSVELQKKIIEEQNNIKAQDDKPEVLKQSEEWANIAKGLGDSVKELCKALNVELNDFIKTPAGKLLVFILVWKLFGSSLIGIFLLSILMIITALSFRYFHTTRFKKLKDGTMQSINYQWKESYGGSAKVFSVIAHIIIFVGSIIVAINIL